VAIIVWKDIQHGKRMFPLEDNVMLRFRLYAPAKYTGFTPFNL
jgi:hypothetical protein